MKRQRERQKQLEQLAKSARRRERSARKKEAKLNPGSEPAEGADPSLFYPADPHSIS